MAKSSAQVDRYRRRCRDRGGVIVYAMITNPKAVHAWKELQKLFGNNRDAIEDALINSYKELNKEYEQADL